MVNVELPAPLFALTAKLFDDPAVFTTTQLVPKIIEQLGTLDPPVLATTGDNDSYKVYVIGGIPVEAVQFKIQLVPADPAKIKFVGGSGKADGIPDKIFEANCSPT